MKKRYFILLLLFGLICSLSVVSASENISLSNTTGTGDMGVLQDNAPVVVANNNTSSSDNSTTDDNGAYFKNDTSDNSTPTVNDSPRVDKVITKHVTSTYGTVAKYTVKVLDQFGKPMPGKAVAVTLNKKTIERLTDENGMVTFTLNCQAGNYIINYQVDNVSGNNSYKVKNKISLSILKWGLKGDVSKVALIKKNMPNNVWVKKAVAATKNGIPLLTFTGGKGKVVFMTAGVHGNELSSIVAAMKMISHLSDNPIKGTVYIMPFVNVKAISKKVRFTDKDYNRIASKSGTIPNKIVNLVVKYKCDSYGDFHTTKPGGVPGKNIVMGSKGPASKSATLTNYIAKSCKVNQKVYKYAGEKYPGSLFEMVNKKKITSVICEVMIKHNTVSAKTINTSYNMMKYFLKFNSII